MHTAACIRVLLLLALGAALLLAGSGYARRRRAVIKLISMACGLADKRRVSPHPGLVRLAQAAKVDRSVRVETVETNCGTLFSGTIAQPADIPLRHVATTLVVWGPQNPKDLGFGGFSPLRFCSCRPFGLKTPASCRTRKSDSPTFCLQKSVVTDFLS